MALTELNSTNMNRIPLTCPAAGSISEIVKMEIG